MDWKKVLAALISVLIPLLYSTIIAKYPSFPLTQEQFLSLFLWIVGLLIGGWSLKSARNSYLFHKRR